MPQLPETSTTLLRDLAGDTDNPRWSEFVSRYRPALASFMATHFPSVDAEDIIQETFIAVAKAIPSYRYVPEEKGYFHNFLLGILRHRAINQLKRNMRWGKVLADYAQESSDRSVDDEDGERNWRKAVYEIALQQLLADRTVADQTKQMFIHTAIDNEKPETVAAAFGVSRDVVDHAKCRLTARLKALVEELKSADVE